MAQHRILFAYVKDRLVPLDKAMIPITDRGFRFGDGVFETMRVKDGHVQHINEHKKRLDDGLDALHITYDTSKLNRLYQKVITKNMLDDGFLRLTITRGEGSRGYLPLNSCTPTVVIEPSPTPITPPSSIRLCISTYRKPIGNMLSAAKSLQSLTSIMARMEAEAHKCEEAIILNTQDHLCECSSSSLFWTKDGTLYTPNKECGGITGTMAAQIKKQSPYPVEEGCYALETLKHADAAFVTNALWGIVHVSEVIGVTEFKKSDVVEDFRGIVE